MKCLSIATFLAMAIIWGLWAGVAALAAQPDEASEKPAAGSDAQGESADKKEGEKPASDEPKPDEKKSADAATKDGAAKSDDKSAKADEKRKTHTVEAKRLRIDLTLDGTFVADKMTEVPFRPDSWSDYEIVEVAKLGQKVHKGEVLFKFDSKKINEAIDDLELEQRINELALARSEEELPRMEKTLKMDFDDADRTDRETKEDFKRYNEIDRPMTIKSAKNMLKYYRFNLDYEKEELEQLEKMYKADDLTEETEEIVLKRQRNAVEFAEFSHENARLNTEEILDIRIPRLDIQMKDALERTELAKARAQMALSLDLNRARYELEQKKKARTKALEKHGKLLADRELMELKSPANGIVYYGQCVNGRWGDTASFTAKYQPHNSVAGNAVVMTIVEPRPLYVTASLDEGKRPDVSDGQKAKVALLSESGDRVGGKVKSVSPLLVTAGKFEVTFDLEQDQIPEWITAGMSCKVNVTTYDKADAITVPKKAVRDDENDPDLHYVWLVDAKDESAKPQRREVKLGKTKGEDVEIVKGLQAGDVISLDEEDSKPKEDAAKK